MNLSALKNYKRLLKYPAGAVMARSGSSHMLVILKGEAAVYTDSLPSQSPDGMLRDGDVFGEKALFLGAPQPSTVIAVTDVFTLTLDHDSILSFFREEPEMSFELMKRLCAIHSPDYEETILPAGQAIVGSAPASLPPDEAASKPSQAPEPSPEPAADEAADDQRAAQSSLFPEGHGTYHFALNNADTVHLMDKGYTCPVCKKDFKTRKVKASRLIVERTDPDMRNHYQGIEPLYYDVVTCPQCLYSALVEQFDAPDMVRAELRAALQAFQPAIAIKTGVELDPFSVFAGYYLALLCAPKCFHNHHLAQAKLWLKLSRLYQDCGDGAMEHLAARKALEEYLYLYLNENSTPEQDQQLCAVIGELYLKQGDIKNARDYYFKAKINRKGTQVMRTQAENRLADIKEMEKAKSEAG